eukprot:s526_g2.t1
MEVPRIGYEEDISMPPQTADEEESRGPLKPIADGRRLPSRPPTVPLTGSGVQGLQDFFTDEEDSSPLAPKKSVPRIPLAPPKRPLRGEAKEQISKPKLPTSASQSFLSDSDSDAKSPPARSSTMPILMEEPIDLSTSPIQQEVGLLSGKTATVQVGLDETVEILRQRAQIALGVGKGLLVDSRGDFLDGSATISEVRVENGDSLIMQLRRVQVQPAHRAFAAVLGDGSAVAWGDIAAGGDSRAVQGQLKNVQQIQASSRAFAAILGDGSVVTWGNAEYGGDSSSVQHQLKNVQQIQASEGAFAAILDDGSVVTWGGANYGGDNSTVQDQLKSVQQVQHSIGAFAAILSDGTVVTWGGADSGGDCTAVQDQLKNVQQIQASGLAFAAIRCDGSVVTWGPAVVGGDSSAVQGQLVNVQQIQASLGAFAAILDDGSIVTWGDVLYGGDSTVVKDQLKNVLKIQASDGAFAAILRDGSVVSWGPAYAGGNSKAVQDQLKNVKQIQTADSAFGAILDDGAVVTWGGEHTGGDSSAVQDQLHNVQQVQASDRAFAAIRRDGSVVTWGDAELGGDSSAVQDQLKSVQQIQASFGAFAAILSDGSVVMWGDAEYGGDSNGIKYELPPFSRSASIPLGREQRKHCKSIGQDTAEVLMEGKRNLDPESLQSPLLPHSADLQLAPAQAQSREMRFPTKAEARPLQSSREDSPKCLVTLRPLPEVSLFVDAEATHPPPTPQFDVTGSSVASPELTPSPAASPAREKSFASPLSDASCGRIEDLGSSPSEAAATTTASLGVASRSIASNGSPRSPFSEETQDLSPSPLKRQLEELEEQQRQIQSSLTQALEYERRLRADEVARCHSLTAELLEALETERRRHSEDIRAWELRLQTQLNEHEAKWLSEFPVFLRSCFSSTSLQPPSPEMPPKIPAWVAAKARAGVKARAAPKARPEAKAKAKAKAKAAARSAPAAAGAKRKAAPREAAPSKVRRTSSADNVGKAKAERSTPMKKATVQAALDETVGTLKRRALAALGIGTGRLLNSSGSISACRDGAFAAILEDGSVVTWGHPHYGGDSRAVKGRLKYVQQIQATEHAFAAILDDGSVVTGGHAGFGADSSAVQTQLKNVQQIQSSGSAFAAILGDGSVGTWGNAANGGDSRAAQDQLKNVTQIQAAQRAFAALLDDGSVVTWGDPDYGGDSRAVQGRLKHVQQIQAAFAAFLDDGSVVTWGDAEFVADSSVLQSQLKHVQQIQASENAFAAILGDGSVVTWGDAGFGADSSTVQTQLKDVQRIQSSGSAFAAILGDGSVVTGGLLMLVVTAARCRDYSVKLNQTNVDGNNNKYYIIQLLTGHGEYHTWNRTYPLHQNDNKHYLLGVGESGQTKFQSFSDVGKAIKDFEKKFRDKTCNAWDNRDDFKKKKLHTRSERFRHRRLQHHSSFGLVNR